MSSSADVYYPEAGGYGGTDPVFEGTEPVYPNLPSNPERDSLLDSSSNDVDPESMRHERGHTRCYNHVDDWDQPEHDHNNSKANWAIALAILGLFFIWPICIISLCLIYDIRRDIIYGYRRVHRHWCKVNTAYWLSVFVIIFGIIEWVFFSFGMWARFHK